MERGRKVRVFLSHQLLELVDLALQCRNPAVGLFLPFPDRSTGHT
jgi:hypothetical protein